jgi:hypothetical protein
MLTVEDCQRRADECARLADATRDPGLRARYRYLETAWLYLFRLKIRARLARPEAAPRPMTLSSA